jgi:HPt (histidine-containing phosphotransfer) domain-containing protein
MGDREKCLAAGMDDYISKPVRIGELQTAIERWGPTKSHKHDTAMLRRVPAAPAEMLDPAVLAELRDMPTAEGVSVLRELIDLFLESAPQNILQIQETAADPARLTFYAHSLKSMSMNLGCKRIIDLAQQLETMGSRGDVKDAPGVIRELGVAFNETKLQLVALRDQEPDRASA